MKKDKEINELIDLLFNEDVDKEKLMLLGFSEEDADRFLQMVQQETSNYLRVLTYDERESFTQDAIIYLLTLLQTRAITRDTFEHVVAVCMQIVYLTRRKCSKAQVDSVLHFIMFINEGQEYSVRDIMDFFEENTIEFDEEVH